ncbi:MAG: twin-arginine translocation signal domain-containing protein [Sulfuriferula multivorans]|uniref:Twin-arginine translocation signal domain-containing protein n=1 Tax=Sulfuriferula multivorans TaxID=1559896 RepID=A0A7C9KAI2_9PROT|nr:twin-arginine translocation signal domain-containing protein [Sulfuriferula multivorans]
MKEKLSPSRRQFLKMGSAAIVMIPAVAVSGNVMAATNSQMRTAMKYQDKPNGEKKCATCIQFVPGKTASSAGGCKIFPGDTEISPHGYCVAWAAKPK